MRDGRKRFSPTRSTQRYVALLFSTDGGRGQGNVVVDNSKPRRRPGLLTNTGTRVSVLLPLLLPLLVCWRRECARGWDVDNAVTAKRRSCRRSVTGAAHTRRWCLNPDGRPRTRRRCVLMNARDSRAHTGGATAVRGQTVRRVHHGRSGTCSARACTTTTTTTATDG